MIRAMSPLGSTSSGIEVLPNGVAGSVALAVSMNSPRSRSVSRTAKSRPAMA